MVNFIIWLFLMVFSRSSVDSALFRYGALHYFESSDFNAAQLFTYMFMHDTRSFAHILFNMFSLFMFGISLERVFGSGRFLFYYLSCGVGAAIFQEAVWYLSLPDMVVSSLAQINNTTAEAIHQYASFHPEIIKQSYNIFTSVGASGAIYGILLAFGMLFPNQPLYLYFIPIPVKAKWMVIGFAVLELLIGLSQANDGVAHFAHLGGMLFGFILLMYWRHNGRKHSGNVGNY